MEEGKSNRAFLCLPLAVFLELATTPVKFKTVTVVYCYDREGGWEGGAEIFQTSMYERSLCMLRDLFVCVYSTENNGFLVNWQ